MDKRSPLHGVNRKIQPIITYHVSPDDAVTAVNESSVLKVIQEFLDEIKENLRTASRTARLRLQFEDDEVINSDDEVSSIHIPNQLQIPRQGDAFGHLNTS